MTYADAIAASAPSQKALSEIAIFAALGASLANYKLPKQIVFASNLPRNTMEKVQKAEQWTAKLPFQSQK